MAKTVRCNLHFPEQVVRAADGMAEIHGISRTAAFIRAIGLAQALDHAAAAGHHVGMCRDRELLEIVLITPRVSA